MIREIFSNQKRFINYFFDQINMVDAEHVLAELIRCRGMIIFTGVGKSGVIADKLAKTMMSIGTRSLYIPASSALHGDIGIVAPEDIVIIISKSGKSQEALDFAANVKRRGIRLISWVSISNSPLERISDLSIRLPLEREICPFDLVPTTSAAVQLIFGDIMAVGLMKAKQFSIADYALNHPAGAIGQLIAERVEDVMIRGDALPLCKPDDKLRDVLFELSRKKCGCLLVADEEMRLQGIFTDGDLRRALSITEEKVLSQTMGQLMINNFLYAEPAMLTSQALNMMEGEKKVMMLPVLDQGKVIGLIHLHHILNRGLVYPHRDAVC